MALFFVNRISREYKDQNMRKSYIKVILLGLYLSLTSCGLIVDLVDGILYMSNIYMWEINLDLFRLKLAIAYFDVFQFFINIMLLFYLVEVITNMKQQAIEN